MTKDAILNLLRDIADAEGGDVSLRRFLALSGLKEKQVVGAHWPTWNEAKREAGLGTVAFVRPRINEESVLPVVAELLAKLGRWPTEAELRLAKRQDNRLPSVKVSRRLERDREFLKDLRAYCETKPHLSAVVGLVTARSRHTREEDAIRVSTVGHVYMMRSGRRYKIGHTSSPSRRHREVRLDLPERTDLVHSIETDDPKGIEAYWHERFATKRIRDTEFFDFSSADVSAFKKRRFQ
jgi:Meiotically Up-regulated Gene 113 (MUG113) protein